MKRNRGRKTQHSTSQSSKTTVREIQRTGKLISAATFNDELTKMLQTRESRTQLGTLAHSNISKPWWLPLPLPLPRPRIQVLGIRIQNTMYNRVTTLAYCTNHNRTLSKRGGKKPALYRKNMSRKCCLP